MKNIKKNRKHTKIIKINHDIYMNYSQNDKVMKK